MRVAVNLDIELDPTQWSQLTGIRGTVAVRDSVKVALATLVADELTARGLTAHVTRKS